MLRASIFSRNTTGTTPAKRKKTASALHRAAPDSRKLIEQREKQRTRSLALRRRRDELFTGLDERRGTRLVERRGGEILDADLFQLDVELKADHAVAENERLIRTSIALLVPITMATASFSKL